MQDLGVHRYTDCYDGPVVVLFALTLVLSVLDAFFTLSVIAGGGIEVNPFMAYCLQFGPVTFLMVKYLLTAGGLIWLLVHQNFRLFNTRLRVRVLMNVIPVCYGLLVLYEIYLLR